MFNYRNTSSVNVRQTCARPIIKICSLWIIRNNIQKPMHVNKDPTLLPPVVPLKYNKPGIFLYLKMAVFWICSALYSGRSLPAVQRSLLLLSSGLPEDHKSHFLRFSVLVARYDRSQNWFQIRLKYFCNESGIARKEFRVFNIQFRAALTYNSRTFTCGMFHFKIYINIVEIYCMRINIL